MRDGVLGLIDEMKTEVLIAEDAQDAGPGDAAGAGGPPEAACGGDLLAAARTFPRYLQYDAWDLGTLGGLPRGAIRRTLKRLQNAGVVTA
jgi:hypothetical protein